MKRGAADFRRAARERGVGRWPVHSCTFCKYECGYRFSGSTVTYDSGCYCSPRLPRPVTWEDVAAHYNMQDSPKVIAQYDEFWGFDGQPEGGEAR